MAGDLFGLSAADRDVLLRMIARERANYSANVRNLAPVPRERNVWKPASKDFAILYNAASTTYDAEGVFEDIEFASAATSNSAKLEPTTNGATNHNAIILHEPGIYCVINDFAILAGSWSYSTTASNISSAFHWYRVSHTIFTNDGVNQSSPSDQTFGEVRSGGYGSCAKASFVFAGAEEYPGKNPLQVRLRVQMNGAFGETFSAATALCQFGVFKVAETRDG